MYSDVTSSVTSSVSAGIEYVKSVLYPLCMISSFEVLVVENDQQKLIFSAGQSLLEIIDLPGGSNVLLWIFGSI